MLILTLCLIVSIGCTTTPTEHVVIIDKTERIVHLEDGELAPFTGWLMAPERLKEIFDALDRKYPPTP